LQINDTTSLSVSDLKKILELFSVDVPLPDAHFDLIHNPHFRELIQKSKSFIVLDNSKGKGIKADKVALKKKIEILLGYGLNNITLCGGFGPDHLDTYFELKRFFRVNFSVDAETRLKTNGHPDIEKIKVYLFQLIRSDVPKECGIEQTRKFLEENRRADWEKTLICDVEFAIHPRVFHAGRFPSSAWFAKEVSSLLKKDTDFCEVGCGSGVISCLVARANPKLRVIATDINPHAKRNTLLNAEKLRLSNQITVYAGDVLDGVDPDKRFDTIFWALPFGFLDPGTSIDLEETQVFDPGYRAIRKFLQTAKRHLKPKGRILVGFSQDLGHSKLLEHIAEQCSIQFIKVRETVLKEETEVQFEILEGKFLSD
jgi:precorrin-6B methylase 2